MTEPVSNPQGRERIVQPTVQPRARTLTDGGGPSYTASPAFQADVLGETANL